MTTLFSIFFMKCSPFLGWIYLLLLFVSQTLGFYLEIQTALWLVTYLSLILKRKLPDDKSCFLLVLVNGQCLTHYLVNMYSKVCEWMIKKREREKE